VTLSHRLPDEPAGWTDLSRLREGTPAQRSAHAALIGSGVTEALASHGPVLVGTIPLDVNVDESDLDVICEVRDPDLFERTLRHRFGGFAGFSCRRTRKDGLPTVIASFRYGTFEIEVFGQPQPTADQHAYRHMVAEARLLSLASATDRETIRALKRAGMKTEPAFASHFSLPGDPYLELLRLSDAPAEELAALVRRAGQRRRRPGSMDRDEA
jgi:hypothetical protein